MIADRGGAVHLLFCVEYERCFYARSDDDGVTWSKPVDITNQAKIPEMTAYWTGPGNGIQLRSGRIVIPSYHVRRLPPERRCARRVR